MSPPRDEGVTLTEVIVTIGLLCVLMAITVAGYQRWNRASEHRGTARELQSLLRITHQRAVTEGNALCVRFDTAADTYTVLAGTCASPGGTVEGPFHDTDDLVELDAPSFGGSDGVTFYARGTATPGSVRVTRAGSTKVYTVAVEGLTGRVSLS
ncbi:MULTISPECIES: GspH/FimT family pseudopilin [unclassified Nocardioides]|uniref:GspH/FimT family pseudopilin n=1 Tax=unclassified Nocardioides TaxID=2615069 RepID=UPI00360F07EF